MKDTDRGLLLLFDHEVKEAMIINLKKMPESNLPHLVTILEEVGNAVLNRYIRMHPHLFTQECSPVKVHNLCGCGKCRDAAIAVFNPRMKDLMAEAGFTRAIPGTGGSLHEVKK
ncbi:MAG: hypothetical protein E6R08_06280 [Nevskiaceae bacterium]|nr:MAG: hypothetical protein E6R08_06280 [Nevskiaceae bacterium]